MTGPRIIEEHTAQWRGVSLRILWEPQFLNTNALVQPGHLQIESTAPRRAPLPITETGYLSWFTSPALVQESGGPVAFVLQWLDAEAAGPAWAQAETDRQQLSLFGWSARQPLEVAAPSLPIQKMVYRHDDKPLAFFVRSYTVCDQKDRGEAGE